MCSLAFNLIYGLHKIFHGIFVVFPSFTKNFCFALKSHMRP